MKQTLNLTTSQQLSLTPQLKQSLKLLQLSALDLEQEIQTMLDSNPLLERDSDIEREPLTQSEGAQPKQDFVHSNRIEPIAEAADPSLEIDRTDSLSAEQSLDNHWQDLTSLRHNPALSSDRKTLSSNNSEGFEFSQYANQPETLQQHLLTQIRLTWLGDKDQLIAESIIQSLDNEGYLTLSTAGISDLFDHELLIEEDEVQAVLSLIKTLEPAGVGAKDLQDRLGILLNQITDSCEYLELAKLIVTEHFSLLAKRDYAQIRKKLRLSNDSCSQAIAFITELNPRIASTFSTDTGNYIIPDLIVKKAKNSWVVELNPDNQSKLTTNNEYARLLKSNIGSEDNAYIQENLMQAKLFIKGLMSRYDTLLAVAQVIVNRQHAFFEEGEQAMVPMVLQDVAQQLEMHESTISRATAGKYLLTPRGVFELKYFFSSALSNTDGATSSSTAIRSLIKELILNESKTKPLSDSKLAQELNTKGHIVARRTIAKYRESMQIAPSSQRKELLR